MKTKRILALATLALLASDAVFAAKITEGEAKDIASKFFNNGSSGLKKAQTADGELRLAGSSTGYYAFNRGASSGFVIVAADDNAASQVIGYADEGNLDMSNLPDNLAWWLEQYDRQQTKTMTASELKWRAEAANRTNIDPMVTSMWDQNSPYNGLCPMRGDTVCPTGCVATAMAQVMYYHKWPNQGAGSNTYRWGSKTISVDFSKSTYDWETMTDRYTQKSSTEAQNAVARIMYDAGVSVNMNYSGGSSGTTSAYVPKAFIENFRYDKDARILFRDFYSYADWCDIVYGELAASRPMYYSGINTKDNVGHAFVCDGYKDGYFHFNWGWGGMGNGYFALYDLAPEQQGTGGSSAGYNSSQHIVAGVQKPRDNAKVTPLFYNQAKFSATSTSVTRGKRAEFSGAFVNYGTYASTVAFGAMVIGESGDTTYIAGTNGNYQPEYGAKTFSVSTTEFPSTDGSYEVYPAYRDANTSQWYKMHTYNIYQNHVNATVSGNTIKFSDPAIEASVLSADGFAATSALYSYKTFTAKATVTNTGGNYAEKLYIIFTKPNSLSPVQVTGGYEAHIDKGMTMNINFDGTTPSSAGTYDMYLVDADGNPVCNKVEVTVAQTPTGALTLRLANKLSIASPTAVSADNINVTANIRCTSGFYGNAVTLAFFKDGESSTSTYLSKNLIIGAGDEMTVNFKGSLPNADIGDKYSACIYYVKDNAYTVLPAIGNDYNMLKFTIGSITGIDDITGTSNGGDVLVYNVAGALVARQKGTADLSNLPKGLYIVKQGNRTVKTRN